MCQNCNKKALKSSWNSSSSLYLKTHNIRRKVWTKASTITHKIYLIIVLWAMINSHEMKQMVKWVCAPYYAKG